MARDQRRQLDSAQNFSPNAPVSFTLPRDNVYKEILLGLEIQVDTAAGQAITLYERGPWTVVKRVELIADGKDVIKSYDGGTLLDINQMDFHTYPQVGTVNIGASASSGLLNLLLIMSMEAVGMQLPQHTWLDARKLSSLELRLTFGNATAGAANDLSSGTAGTLTTFRVTPYGHEILDIDPKSTFSVNQEVMTSFSFPTNTATQRLFLLNVGNAYRRIIISTVDQNARAAVDRFLTMNLLQNGSFYRRRWQAGFLKQHNTIKNQLPVGLGIGSAATSNPAAGSATGGLTGGSRLGLYELDIAEDGSEESLLDSFGFSDLSLETDWGGSNTTDLMRFTPALYIPALR